VFYVPTNSIQGRYKDSIVVFRSFASSSSDVQKRLRELLPSDYSKEYKAFRPLNDHSMSPRLAKLRTKQHRRSSPSRDVQARSKGFQEFEGPASAFRNYLGPNETPVGHQPVDSYGHELESQIVVPSHLLLDGSTIMPTINDHPVLNHSSQFPVANPVSLIRRASSVISLERIEERIKRSSSFAKQVHAVLRFSSTNSWRSSISFRSSGSSLRMQSIISLVQHSRPTSETQLKVTSLSHPGSFLGLLYLASSVKDYCRNQIQGLRFSHQSREW